MLQSVATNRNLDDVGRNANLAAFIIPDPCHATEPISPRTMADTIEAILGAVYHDTDFTLASVKTAMRKLGLGPV